MEKIINYEKDIEFNTKIGEITSISLEDYFNVENGKLNGNFVLSGEYKANELSINKEAFEYKLPLEYEFDGGVEFDTLKKEIDNFDYKVEDNKLCIMIDYKLEYDVKPIIPTEEELNEDIELIEERKEIEEIEEIEEPEEIKAFEKEEVNIETEETCIYHIHMFKEGETIESIAALYGADVDLIKEYNDINNLNDKQRIIVPITNE